MTPARSPSTSRALMQPSATRASAPCASRTRSSTSSARVTMTHGRQWTREHRDVRVNAHLARGAGHAVAGPHRREPASPRVPRGAACRWRRRSRRTSPPPCCCSPSGRASPRPGAASLDPLCGSGTLPIEAALMAADVAPGLLRAGRATASASRGGSATTPACWGRAARRGARAARRRAEPPAGGRARPHPRRRPRPARAARRTSSACAARACRTWSSSAGLERGRPRHPLAPHRGRRRSARRQPALRRAARRARGGARRLRSCSARACATGFTGWPAAVLAADRRLIAATACDRQARDDACTTAPCRSRWPCSSRRSRAPLRQPRSGAAAAPQPPRRASRGGRRASHRGRRRVRARAPGSAHLFGSAPCRPSRRRRGAVRQPAPQEPAPAGALAAPRGHHAATASTTPTCPTSTWSSTSTATG